MGTINADFSGETAVVTGASSGIGRAVANGFGDAGATVINADVRAAPKDLDAEAPTHEAIEDRGGTAVFVETDVSRPDADRVGDRGGRRVRWSRRDGEQRGRPPQRRVPRRHPEDFDFVHGVNLRGAFFGTQLAAQDMIDRGVEGTIVNTSSTTAERAEWNHSHYAATKGGIQMLTRSAALELDRHGIRVNAVAPGPIATEIREGWSKRRVILSENPETSVPSRHSCGPA